MPRPDFVTNEDLSRWDTEIDNDPNLPKSLADNPIIREVCYAGEWLVEELRKLGCPDEFIARIRYTAGQLSYGREIWEVHRNMLEAYKNNQLEYEVDYNELN